MDRSHLQTRYRRGLVMVAAGMASLGTIGCGEGVDGSATGEDVAQNDSAIIGGINISVATRRSLGLIDVPGCSGALMSPDWVLTAGHCINWANPTSMVLQAPRTDGTFDSRTALRVVRVGTADMAMIRLQGGAAGNQWPNVSHAVTTSTEASFVGTNLTCYGRGNTAYQADGTGVTGFGIWKQMTKNIVSLNPDSLNGDAYRVVAVGNPGTEVYSWGDSGSNCIASNQVVGVETNGGCSSWQGQGLPGDPGCNQNNVISQLDNFLRATADFRSYMTESMNRPGQTFQPLTLVNGWTPAPFSTNLPGAGLEQGIVTLRGAMATGGANMVAFTLPAGLRPSAETYVTVNLCGGAKGRLHINTAGTTDVQGTVSDAQCFTSLEGVSFAVNNSGYTNLALLNGWVNSVFSTRPAASKEIGGVIHLQGAIGNGTTTTLFTLPVGHRPTTTVYAQVDLCGNTKGRLIINTSGSVTVQAFAAFSDAQCFTSLEGVAFATGNAGFTNMTLLNGWTGSPFSTRAPAAKNDQGIIRFQGAMATSGTTMTAFTLPVSMRPATDVYSVVDLCGSEQGRILIQPSGNVSVQGTLSSAQCFTSLESVSFGI